MPEVTTITPDLQALVMGDRNIFLFQEYEKDQLVNTGMHTGIIASDIAIYLNELRAENYMIVNPMALAHYSQTSFERYKKEFTQLINSTTKEGLIFRHNFAKTEDLIPYTQEDWLAILAQYAITYGWESEYDKYFPQEAQNVLTKYCGMIDLSVQANISNTKMKTFTVGSEHRLVQLLRDIIESKTVLRAQQLETLNAAPIAVILQAAKHANITIKETLVKVMHMLRNQNLDFPLLRTATDVLRFAVTAFAKENPVEGQLSVSQLKDVRLRIPISMRKILIKNLELIGERKGAYDLCEDMFKFEAFWIILARYLRWEKSIKSTRKFPKYTKAIDLLYNGDRSWTFNSRYEAAKTDLDYKQVVTIAKQRPGFLLRNMLEYLRMTEGTPLPVKKDTIHTSKQVYNAFTAALNKTDINNKTVKVLTVKTDGNAYFKSSEFRDMLSKSVNNKLAWQLVEQLNDKRIYELRFEREVQGQLVEYSTPLPGVNLDIANEVKSALIGALYVNIRTNNPDIKSVFIDDNAVGYKLQYSGRKSTDISYAGEFLSPGSEISIAALLESKDIENPIVRLGVMWRGKHSVDIDHSITLSNGEIIWYGNTSWNHPGIETAITSSGDVVTCGPNLFSTELIDIDVSLIDANKITDMFSSFIVYHGAESIGKTECYVFFSVIDKKDRVLSGNKISIDLMQQDYAIRIDPDNEDKTGSYIGCSIDLQEGFIKVHALPIKGKTRNYSNAILEYKAMKKAIENAPSTTGLTYDYTLQEIFVPVNSIQTADLIISKHAESYYQNLNIDMKKTKILHPGRDQEQLNQILF